MCIEVTSFSELSGLCPFSLCLSRVLVALVGGEAVTFPRLKQVLRVRIENQLPSVQQAGRKGDMGPFPFVAVE